MSADTPEMLQRREVLKRVAWLLGGAVSAPAALAILQGCSPKDAAPVAGAWQPKFFTGKQASVVTAIADAIIPKTDTSGALDVGVPAFIDLVMADVYDAAARERFNQGFAEFEIGASTGGKPFLERDAAGRAAFVKESLEKALAAPRDAGRPFILMARELTLLGFYTSQPGITENMWYQAVPTAFHGCVPLAKMEKPVYWE
jgi:gluconate 2-dehydrogenase gamma chain